MNLSDLQYKISKDYNKLTKEQKIDFKGKLLDIIIADLAVKYLTDRVWNDEQFFERFKTSDRHEILTTNIHEYKVNLKVLEWIERYGDQAQELLAQYNITPPREHKYVYTVERFAQNYDIQYQLKYCSDNYEKSLSELKEVSLDPSEGRAILVAWYNGEPQFVQWANGGEVFDKEDYNKTNACTSETDRFIRY